MRGCDCQASQGSHALVVPMETRLQQVKVQSLTGDSVLVYMRVSVFVCMCVCVLAYQ